MEQNIKWETVLDGWNLDKNPANFSTGYETVVGFTREFDEDAIEIDDNLTVVIRVLQNQSDNFMVSVHELMDGESLYVCRIPCQNMKDASTEVKSASAVYKDGRSAVRSWLINSTQKRLKDIARTFDFETVEINITEDYVVKIMVDDTISYDAVTVVESLFGDINVGTRNSNIELLCERPIMVSMD